MAKTDDYSKKAADFLRLWQEQLARQMTDPTAIHALLSALTAHHPRGSHDATAPYTAAANPADDDAIRQLTWRVEQLERQLVGLQQSLHASPKKPAGAGKRAMEKSRADKPAAKRRPAKAAKRSVAKRVKPASKPKAKIKKR